MRIAAISAIFSCATEGESWEYFNSHVTSEMYPYVKALAIEYDKRYPIPPYTEQRVDGISCSSACAAYQNLFRLHFLLYNGIARGYLGDEAEDSEIQILRNGMFIPGPARFCRWRIFSGGL